MCVDIPTETLLSSAVILVAKSVFGMVVTARRHRSAQAILYTIKSFVYWWVYLFEFYIHNGLVELILKTRRTDVKVNVLWFSFNFSKRRVSTKVFTFPLNVYIFSLDNPT